MTYVDMTLLSVKPQGGFRPTLNHQYSATSLNYRASCSNMCGGSLRRLDTFGRQRSTFGTRLRVLTAATGSVALAAAKFKQLLLKGNPEVAAISSVYLVQGLTDLAYLAQKFFLKDLGASPAQLAIYLSICNLPWIFKPVIGFVSDTVPLWGYRRRSYLLLAGVTASLAWLTLWGEAQNIPGTIALILICSSAGAVSDVVADSLVVERARDEPQESAGSLQAMCWTWHAVGQVATAALGGSLVQEYGPRAVFGLTGAFPTLIMLAAFVVQEEPVRKGAAAVVSTIVMPIAMLQPAGADSASHDSGGLPAAASTAAVRATVAASSTASTTTGAVSSSSNSLSGKPGMPSAAASPGMASTPLVGLGSLIRGFYDQVSTLSVAMKDKDITPALAFLFLLSATPSYDDAIFYFHTDVLRFEPAFLGKVHLAIALASLIAVAVYNKYLKDLPLAKFLLWGNLLGAGMQATDMLLVTRANVTLGLDDHLFVMGGCVVTAVITNVLSMPMLLLAARVCPPGYEATMFASIMGLLNLADGVRHMSGGVLMSVFGVTTGHYDNLPLLVLACNLSLLLPLTVLARIPKSLGDWSPSQPVPASMSMSSSSSSLESMENPLLASSASGNSPLNSSKFAVPGEPAAGQVASGDDLIAMPSLVPAALTAFTISPRAVTVRQVAALTMRATLTAECSTDSTNSTWSDDEEAGPSGVSYRDPIAFRAVGKGQLDRLVSSRRSRVASEDGYLDNAASIRPWSGWDGWSGSDIDNGSSMDSSTVSTSSDPQQPHAASSLDASMPQPVVQGPSADSQRPGEGRQHGGEEYGVLIGSDQHGMYAAVGELERKRRKRQSKRKARTPPTGSNATDQQKQ